MGGIKRPGLLFKMIWLVRKKESEFIKRLNDVKASERGKRMKSRNKSLAALMFGTACFLLAASTINPIRSTSAQGDDCLDPARCGQVSPLIPMQSAEAVHMGLVWKRSSSTPKILTPGFRSTPRMTSLTPRWWTWPSCAEPLPRPDFSSTHR
jgi:hypothetical protein